MDETLLYFDDNGDPVYSRPTLPADVWSLLGGGERGETEACGIDPRSLPMLVREWERTARLAEPTRWAKYRTVVKNLRRASLSQRRWITERLKLKGFPEPRSLVDTERLARAVLDLGTPSFTVVGLLNDDAASDDAA
jgi:hypothetical protein